jgi:hypothetical protein
VLVAALVVAATMIPRHMRAAQAQAEADADVVSGDGCGGELEGELVG